MVDHSRDDSPPPPRDARVLPGFFAIERALPLSFAAIVTARTGKA